MKFGVVELQKNTVLVVNEKGTKQEAGGTAGFSLANGMSNVELLHKRSTLMCSSLEVTLPEDNSYVWVAFLLNYCYPFMQTLTLNRCGA